jgi:thiol:disulfide interchange protein DsbD
MSEPDYASWSLSTFVLVYASGLATSLTPCVYPMIPIVMGYVGAGAGGLKARARGALLYVTGLSFIYALLGVAAAATGNMFGELTATPAVYVSFGVAVLILGGGMMGWYEIPVPRFLSGSSATGEKPDESWWRPLLVGASSGVVASPCTAPVMGGILIYIASERQYFKGALLMLVFAAGMNTLLLAVGLFAGAVSVLPRSGAWMVAVKKVLALLLLGGGIYFIYRAGQIS